MTKKLCTANSECFNIWRLYVHSFLFIIVLLSFGEYLIWLFLWVCAFDHMDNITIFSIRIGTKHCWISEGVFI